jgi:hypothetical protein
VADQAHHPPTPLTINCRSLLLVGAGHAVVLFAFCYSCRDELDTEVKADLTWIAPCPG